MLLYIYNINKLNILLFILLYYSTILRRTIFTCKNVNILNISTTSMSSIKNIHFISTSKSRFVYILFNKRMDKQYLKNIDDENLKLLLLKNAYVTERVIIRNCRILFFSGQCEDRRWYINNIRHNEVVNSIENGFILTNWHGDGVFHGTVEGLTRIVPYINYLLINTYIYILIPFPRYNQNTASNILQLIGFSYKRILYGKYFVRKLYIPTPFYCVESSTPLVIAFNEILRSKMKYRNCLSSGKNYILIIQRSKNRIIKEYDLLKSELLNNFNYTIITYYDSNNNLNEIYCWFTYAKIIIAYHGSGLTNIYFSKRSTTVIELSPKNAIYAFAKLGSQLGLNYYIYKLHYTKLYIKYILFNISMFISTLKIHKIFQ